MGHDLGHTPFGHAGEKVLARLMPDGFHHVKQSLRVVEVLEREGRGLNLSAEVRDGILKHSKGKGHIISENPNLLAMTLEGQIVRIADIVAYVNHDLDDSIRAKVLSAEEVPPEILDRLGRSHSERICSLARFVGFEIPQRRPDGFDCLDEFLISANIRDGGVESGAAKVWQVFGVGRAAHKQTLPGKLQLHPAQNLGPQFVIKLPLLDAIAQTHELLTTIGRVVNEFLIVQHRIQGVVQFVLA